MADVKYLTSAGLVRYDGNIKTYIDSAKTLGIKKVLWDNTAEKIKFYKNPEAVVTDTADFEVSVASSDVASLKTRVGMESTLNAYLEKTNVTDILNILTSADTVDGSIAKLIKTAVDTLDGELADVAKSGEASDVNVTAITGLSSSDVQSALEEIQGEIDTINDETNGILKQAKDYTDELANGAVAENTTAINAINDPETGILKQAKDYTDELANGQVATNASDIQTINDTIGTVESGKTVVGMIGDVQGNLDSYIASNDQRVEDVEGDVSDIQTTIGDMTAVKTTAKTVAGAVDELKDAIDSTGTAGKVTIEEISTGLPSDVLKKYEFFQGVKSDDTEEQKAAKKIGTINLAKDLVVTSGEVVKNPEGQEPGTYIKLTIANQEAPIFINVKDLVEDFTVAKDATEVQLAVSDTREISAALVDGGISTAKIADKAVTKAKLEQDVQDVLDKVDATYQVAGEDVSAKEYIDARVFIGTQAEYDAKYAAKKIDDTTVSIIVDEDANELVPISDDEIDALFAD